MFPSNFVTKLWATRIAKPTPPSSSVFAPLCLSPSFPFPCKMDDDNLKKLLGSLRQRKGDVPAKDPWQIVGEQFVLEFLLHHGYNVTAEVFEAEARVDRVRGGRRKKWNEMKWNGKLPCFRLDFDWADLSLLFSRCSMTVKEGNCLRSSHDLNLNAFKRQQLVRNSFSFFFSFFFLLSLFDLFPDWSFLDFEESDLVKLLWESEKRSREKADEHRASTLEFKDWPSARQGHPVQSRSQSQSQSRSQSQSQFQLPPRNRSARLALLAFTSDLSQTHCIVDFLLCVLLSDCESQQFTSLNKSFVERSTGARASCRTQKGASW